MHCGCSSSLLLLFVISPLLSLLVKYQCWSSVSRANQSVLQCSFVTESSPWFCGGSLACLPCSTMVPLSLQPAARKPPPKEPCQNGALILSPLMIIGRRHWMDNVWWRYRDLATAAGSDGGRDSVAVRHLGTHNLLFSTYLAPSKLAAY